jgi:hypothetical protein
VRGKAPDVRKRVRSIVAVLWLSLLLSGCAGRGAMSPSAAAPHAAIGDGLARLRVATRPFHALDSAVAAGYARDVPDCLVHEHHGAMGFHHVNRGYVDAVVDVERPEILLYERRPDGEYRLNGVEFIVPYRAWPRDSVAPTLMGQRLKREDNLKIWYLHVWAWTDNTDGVFADFNPAVSCSDTARRVFKPFSAP